jgi:uncharacterized protein (DUF4415 family)
MSRAPLTDAEGEVRELTAEDFKHFRPARDVLSELWGQASTDEFLAAGRRLRGQRGPQKAPVKKGVYLRVDADVLERFKASGPGWQTRMNQTLRQGMPQ